MKFAIANIANHARKRPMPLFILLAVAAVSGVLLHPWDPSSVSKPFMAPQAVILPDGAAIYVQKYEVTVAEWNACHKAEACSQVLTAKGGHAEDETPATGLSFVDVSEYLAWINTATGETYRLPSIKEWKFMAAEVLPEKPDPIFTDAELTWAADYLTVPQTKRTLRPQGSFATTSQGITDLNGSVWEWTQDCYAGASQGEITRDRCPAFFVGGEHVTAMSFLIRDPARGGCAVGSPPAHLGMRLVSDHKT